MRVVLSVVALVVAVFALAMTFLSGGGEQQGQGSDEVARLKVRVSALERGVTDLRSGLDEVSAGLADMRAAVASRSQQSSQKPETSPSQASPTKPPSTARSAPSDEWLREVVREEIRRYYEDLRKGGSRGPKERQPEDWERKEFGSWAGAVHYLGEKLGLSKEQKRAYFQVLERFRKQRKEVLDRIKSATGGYYDKRTTELIEEEWRKILEQARREVESLLTPQQCTKYRELIEKKDPYMRRHP